MKKFFWRVLATSLVLTSVLTGASHMASAEETTTTTTSSTSTTTTTTVPSTTVDGGDTTTTSQGTTTTGQGVSTTIPTDTDAAGSDETEDGETTTTTDGDPLSEEEPADTVPDTDITVPEDDEINSSGRYASQGKFEPNEVLWSSVREAEQKVENARADLQTAIARVKALRLRQKELAGDESGLDEETREALEALTVAEDRVRDRALGAFVEGGEITIDPGSDHDQILGAQVQDHLIQQIFLADDRAIADVETMREALEGQTLRTLDRSALVADLMRTFEAEVDEHRQRLEQAEKELETFAAGSEIYVEGLVFPIGELAYEVPLIDSYGFPRMLGTEDEHWHEGIDIFAPMGAPLVAAERGVITNIGTGKLGGLKVWLRGASGTDWYYAHLADFAEGLAVGQVMEAGDLLGYVGTTGNAVGTPPHLHMQVHPGGNDAVNPYPMLLVASDREIAAVELLQERLDAEAARTAANAKYKLSSAHRVE